MNFDEIASAFERSNSGTDAFKTLYRSLLQLMRVQPDRAAACFIIASAAHNYVMRYEDQAISAELADGAKLTVETFLQRLREVWDSTPAERLSVLDSLAFQYEWNVPDF